MKLNRDTENSTSLFDLLLNRFESQSRESAGCLDDETQLPPVVGVADASNQQPSSKKKKKGDFVTFETKTSICSAHVADSDNVVSDISDFLASDDESSICHDNTDDAWCDNDLGLFFCDNGDTTLVWFTDTACAL